MTDAAYRKARAESTVASKSFANRRLRIALVSVGLADMLLSGSWGPHVATPGLVSATPGNHADSSHSTSFGMTLSTQMNEQFYDSMADYYHLIFEDWDASMRRQGAAIAKLLPPPEEVGLILDVACGIGTQSLALAAIGYSVEGSDISAVEIARAQREAASRGLKCSFRVDDMRILKTASVGRYGAIIAMDNALPHLDSDDDILSTFAAMRSSLLPGGKVLVSVRDYARHLQERHTCLPPVFYSDNGQRRIVFQVWDWIDERRYVVHLYVTQETVDGWIVHHFAGKYRAVTPEEIARLANQAGFQEVCVLPSSNTGFYQPIIVAEAA